MANFTALKTAINNAIKTNGNEEITGAILQAILDAMVETLGDSAINDLENAITTEVTNRENAVGGVADDLAAEALARANKDNHLDGRINQEEYNRQNADAALSQTMSQGFQTLGSQMTALNAAISALNAAYQNGFLYGGIATPSSSPSNNKCFYIALQGGTYTNFGGVGVVEGINIIKNDSGWKVEHIYDQTTLLNEFYLLRQQVIQAITSFAPIVIEGDVTNAPDEEDLTSNANHLLQFKNNAYSPLEFSGLGRKYLRKNIAPLSESAPFNGFVEGVTAEETLSGTPTQIFWDRMNTRFVGIKDGIYYAAWTDDDNYVPVSTSLVYMYNGTPYQWTGSDFIVDETEVPNLVNCLTQDMINEANTIYIIRYDYTLKEDITIPANCVLEFDGGSISGTFTITGNNTSINAAPIGVFGNNVEIAGTWNVEYVLLDWFMPDGNGYYDNSFINAIKIKGVLHCTANKVYNFSGELVDCRNWYGKLHIIGNNCNFNDFYFGYDIKTNGESHIASSVAAYSNIIEGISFIGNFTNDIPCIFTATYIEIRDCNFTDYNNVLGFTPRYVDYIKLSNIYTWNNNDVRMNLFGVYNYDYTEATGFTADWIYLDSVHSKSYIRIGTNDVLNIYMCNCLHILFEFANNSALYQYSVVTCYAVNCHWENFTPIIANNNLYLNLQNSFIFDKCYFYSTALPQDERVLKCVILRESKIVYWNNDNFAQLPDLHKSMEANYIIIDGSGILKYADTKFIDYNLKPNRVIEGVITPANANGYYPTITQISAADKPNYTEAQSTQYLVAYSTRKDCLYNGGNVPNVFWSNTVNIPSGKYVALNMYINETPQAYIHVYRKDMNNNSIKYVVLKASSVNAQTGYEQVRIFDTALGVYGHPWQEYTGQEEDIKYVASV